MLINLSNHEAYKMEDGKKTYVWKEKQLKAASMYGEIIDIPFPNIPPEYTTEQVQDLAMQYLHKCEELLRTTKKQSAVHVTGEVTFCFALIQMLLRNGYTCLTATSKRDVKEGENGEKIINFKFEHFREYKLI